MCVCVVCVKEGGGRERESQTAVKESWMAHLVASERVKYEDLSPLSALVEGSQQLIDGG